MPFSEFVYPASILLAAISFFFLQLIMTFEEEYSNQKLFWLLLLIISNVFACWSVGFRYTHTIYTLTLIIFVSAVFSAIGIYFHGKQYFALNAWSWFIILSSLFVIAMNMAVYFGERRYLFLDFNFQIWNIVYVLVFLLGRLTEFIGPKSS